VINQVQFTLQIPERRGLQGFGPRSLFKVERLLPAFSWTKDGQVVHQTLQEVVMPVGVNSCWYRVFSHITIEFIKQLQQVFDMLRLLHCQIMFSWVVQDSLNDLNNRGSEGATVDVDGVSLHIDHILNTELFAALDSILNHFRNS